MYSPNFQNFNKRQVLVSSDRVTLYAKEDSVFLLGSQVVSLSSKNSINLDSKNQILLYSPKIELGSNATHPVIYGDELVRSLDRYLSNSQTALNDLQKNISGGENDIKKSMQLIRDTAIKLHGYCGDLRGALNNTLSKTTFTA